MSIVISVIILILSMLISFCMQLPSGTFALFYHYALGKTNSKKADDQSLSFILGAEIFVTIVWLFIYFLTFTFFYNFPDFNNIFLCIMSGIFLAEALITFFFYYKKGKKSTALFISRSLAAGITNRIKKAHTRSDCILIGAFIGAFELLFTLPLYLISTNVLLNFPALPRIFFIAFYVLFSVLPLFIVRYAFRLNNNLADIERFRVKIKPLVKLIFFFSFLALSLATIYLGVINHG